MLKFETLERSRIRIFAIQIKLDTNRRTRISKYIHNCIIHLTSTQGDFLVFLNQPDYRVSEPVPPGSGLEIAVEQLPGRGKMPGLAVRVLRREEELGFCKSLSVGRYCRASEAQDWLFIKALYIHDEVEQGKGWGRYLLQRNLWEMRKIGYKNAVISTDWRNYRALLLYANYGYEVSDTVYGFVKGKEHDMP